MISVTEAQHIIAERTPVSPIMHYALVEALHCQLARDIQAPYDLPLFANSAMDGFAIRAADIDMATAQTPLILPVQMVVKAGDNPGALYPGRAAKIMTGAMIPAGADAVVIKEEADETANGVRFIRPTTIGANIRHRGEEIRAGAIAMKQGAILNPASIGFLSSLGIQSVPTYRKPQIALMATGNELVQSPQHLQAGKIFDSNTSSLAAALQEVPYQLLRQLICPDSIQDLKQVLTEELHCCDFLILSGGVSVGDYDFTKSVLNDLQVETVFWQVAQKPGKPMYFGMKENTCVFGLPGNPVSALLCYYEYVRPALRKFLGASGLHLETGTAELNGSFAKKSGFSHFLRASAYYQDGQLKVTPLNGQGSHMMHSFAEANCLIVAPETTTQLDAGQPVTVHWLPTVRRPTHG